MHRLHQGFIILQRRGIKYLIYLVAGYAMPKVGYYFLYQFPRKWVRRLFLVGTGSSILLIGTFLVWVVGWGITIIVLLGIGLLVSVILWLRRVISQRKKLVFARQYLSTRGGYLNHKFSSWNEYPLDPDTRQAIESVRPDNPLEELVIGQIDNDGRVYGQYGPLPYVHNIHRDEFVSRYRFPLDIILLNDLVLVRKDFRGNRERFVCEWHNLARLEGVANTPAIYKVDEKTCIVYKNLILGRTVRDILVDAGANILTVEVQKDSSLQDLSEDERIHTVWERGKALLFSTLPESFFEQLEEQLDGIHAQGLAKLSLTFGNIMINAEDGHPWLVDMEGAESFAPVGGFLFDYERNRDREKYNQIYGRTIVTEQSARQILSAYFSNVYAPVDFGRGLATHGFWTTDSGSGRWEYLNERVVVPLVKGKRVLDLGANNGILDLMMLKSGACEVIGLEFSPDYTEMARMVQQLFEWRDMCNYALTIHHCDMREILTTSFGEFGVVTAFCSLYYLEPEDMAAVVRKASNIAPVMILQAKTHARPEAKAKGKKSSPEYLALLLNQNGFPNVKTIAPKGFTRPILIGRK